MKSGKQRRREIIANRKKRAVKRAALPNVVGFRARPYTFVPVNEELLAPDNSYGAPDFVGRGYYIDIPFRCVDCAKEEIWTGTQQKWWYEVAKGFVYSTAIRCRACRRRERDRRAEARRVHLEGMARKQKGTTAKPRNST
jgi:Probable zinc-ribbon domain